MKPAETTSLETVSIQTLQWLENRTEDIRGVCERRKLLLLGAISCGYYVATSVLAARKPIWNDEFFTYFIARAPTLSSVWAALLTGADQNPFPFYVLTRWSLALFGVHEWALRLPEMIGVWVAGLCLFHIVSRRTGGLYGLAAMGFLFVTGANFYSYEARPYGLVLAFTAFAWWCWQQAADGRFRRLSIPGLAAGLSGAVCSHYYAVFMFLPLGFGELTRSIIRKRVDRPVWLAMGIALIPLLFFLPLIERASSYADHFWAQSSLRSIPDAYANLLMPAPLLVVAVMLIGGLYAVVLPVGFRGSSSRNPYFVPAHEIVAALGYASIPIVMVVATMMTTGAFTVRYALPAVLGVSVLIAIASARLLGSRAILGVTLLLLSCLGFGILSARNFHNTPMTLLEKTYDVLKNERQNNLPVVVSDAHSFMALSYYAPRDLSDRLVYLADPAAAVRQLGFDTVDRGILDLKPWFGLNIEKYREYVGAQAKFLVYVDSTRLSGLNWLMSELRTAGFGLELRAASGDQLLFMATREARPSAP